MKLKINYSSLNFFLFPFSFLLLIIITLLSCTSTSPQTGSLSGTINLEAQTDHSGIVIGIYELSELDPDIVEANQKWPHIGVIINQHTEFDHRFGTLIKTGETNASGYFEINDIPTGVYNMVAIKDSFGFRYIYNVQISDGDNEFIEKNKEQRSKIKENQTQAKNFSLSSLVFDLNNSNRDLTLFHETIIYSDIDTATIWHSHHHYIIDKDIIIDDELTIEPGAIIRLNEGKELTNYGTFNAVGEYENFIWFTKNDGFSENLNTVETDSNYIWDRITLEPYSQAQVKWSKFDHAGTGLLSKVNGFEISDCIFRDSQCGFKAESLDSVFCNNFLCKNITNSSYAGIYFDHIENGCIEKNICYDCETGIQIKSLSYPISRNNYCSNCKKGIYITQYSSPIIYNNTYTNCEIGIYTFENTCPVIEKNMISCNIGFYNSYHIYDPIEFHYNNLNCSEYSIQLAQTDLHSGDINASNNYFYTNDMLEIQDNIFDSTDATGFHHENVGVVNFLPFLNNEYPYAGIQGE